MNGQPVGGSRPGRSGLGDTAIEFSGVSFGYGGRDVLHDVTFSLGEGTFTALIGPNGAGKTTLLRLLLGLEKPDQGTIFVFGRPSGSKQEIGYVPQRTGVPEGFPLSTEEVVLMGRYASVGWGRRPGRADREAAKRALARVHLSDAAGDRFSELSGGQQRRALIARALVAGPRLLLMDEPTAGLDPAAQARFYDTCCTLQREAGITLVAASHDIDVVARHADMVLLLDRSVQAVGRPRDVLASDRLDRVYNFPHGHVHASVPAAPDAPVAQDAPAAGGSSAGPVSPGEDA